LYILYTKKYQIDYLIEEIEQDFEKEKSNIENKAIAMEYITKQIESVQFEKDRRTAPLLRQKEVIISNIPFLK
jgi:protein subunit release factor B